MARRRSALPVISEPALDPEHITALLEEESRRRNSTNSIHLSEHGGNKLVVNSNGERSLEYTGQATERFKLSVVGDSECGKTSLLNALVKSDFDAVFKFPSVMLQDHEYAKFTLVEKHRMKFFIGGDNLDTKLQVLRLLNTFRVDNVYNKAEESCIFDECVTDIITEESRLEVMLWEISGLEDYESIRREMYRDSDVILICFDIGHPPSLQSVVSKWVPEVSNACPGVPYLLIGCKNDLRTDSALQFYLTVPGQAQEESDSISRMQAVSVAQTIMARDYVECCAKTRWNVKEVFKSAADAILHKDDKDEGKEEPNKSQSVLRKFSWFTRRSSSGSDVNDCNTVARSVSGSRRLSLFTTS